MYVSTERKSDVGGRSYCPFLVFHANIPQKQKYDRIH